MSEIKYTNDGKKVAVIGQLNSKETIVQEIFVSDDCEIPSGENFIVKSLHDKPAISWKEKKIIELNDLHSRLQNENDLLSAKLNKERSTLNAHLNQILSYNKNLSSDIFKTVSMFLSGEIKYIVSSSFSNYEVKLFEEYLLDGYSGNEIKLMTLFGNAKGETHWRISNYSDGSGSNVTVHPCRSMAESIAKIDSMIFDSAKKYVTQPMIDAKNKYKLCNPTEKQISEYKDKRVKDIKKMIITNTDQIEKYNKQIEDLCCSG